MSRGLSRQSRQFKANEKDQRFCGPKIAVKRAEPPKRGPVQAPAKITAKEDRHDFGFVMDRAMERTLEFMAARREE